MYELFETESRQEGAACADRRDVDFFAPSDDDGSVTRAKTVCTACTVRLDCLEFAVATDQPDGIWGGLTAKERAPIRRRWLAALRKAS